MLFLLWWNAPIANNTTTETQNYFGILLNEVVLDNLWVIPTLGGIFTRTKHSNP